MSQQQQQQQQHNNNNNNNGSIDLECGGEITSECFTDAEEEKENCSSSSCYSPNEFYSTYGDEDEDEVEDEGGGGDEIVCRTVSSSSSSLTLDDCCSVVIDVHLQLQDDSSSSKECRICQMSVNEMGKNDAIELGCSCKHDLAVAHQDCALTWFKIKGNKTCEICNSIVSNLVVPNDMMPSTPDVTMDDNPTVRVRGAHNITSTRGGCINGHRLLNFILACLVFSFVISWLFHFNIPS